MIEFQWMEIYIIQFLSHGIPMFQCGTCQPDFDTTPPTTDTTIKMNWQGDSTVGYSSITVIVNGEVYNPDSAPDFTQDGNFSITGLTAETTYHVIIRADGNTIFDRNDITTGKLYGTLCLRIICSEVNDNASEKKI